MIGAYFYFYPACLCWEVHSVIEKRVMCQKWGKSEKECEEKELEQIGKLDVWFLGCGKKTVCVTAA